MFVAQKLSPRSVPQAPQINGFNYVFTFPSDINIFCCCWPGRLLLGLQGFRLCARLLPVNVQPRAADPVFATYETRLAQDQVPQRSVGEGKVETTVLPMPFLY